MIYYRDYKYRLDYPEYLNFLKRNNDDKESYSLLIPKAHARDEKTSKDYVVSRDNIKDVPHYEIIISKQMGPSRNGRDTDIYYKLPISGHLIRIILHSGGGVSFDKKFHTMLLHETDETDRLVVLGFCIKYQYVLKEACHEEFYNESTRMWLHLYARMYVKTMMPKRLYQGRLGHNEFDTPPLNPYVEYTMFKIFSNLKMV